MNAGQLHALLEHEVDDVVDFARALDWFNACSDDLAEVARVRATHVENSWPGGSTYNLPANLVTLIEVRYRDTATPDAAPLFDLALYPFEHRGYRRWGQTLHFSENLAAGALELDYHRTLARLTTQTDVPEIPEPFHMAYVYFAAVRWHRNLSKDEIVARARAVEQDYFRLKFELDLHTRAQGPEGPVRMRDVLPRSERRWRRQLTPEEWVAES